MIAHCIFIFRLYLNAIPWRLGTLVSWSPRLLAFSYDLLMGMYLGGVESRCYGYRSCSYPYRIDSCVEAAIISQIPYSLTVHRPELDAGAVAWTQRPLPLCLNGNHRGRWLAVPYQVSEWCNKTTNDHQRTSEKDWRALLSSSLGNDELMRYLAGGDVCSMLVPASGIMPGVMMKEAAHAVFAPYACKYHLFWPEEKKQCLEKHVSPLLFSGDSMIRNMYVEFSRVMGYSTLTAREAKKLTNVEKQSLLSIKESNMKVEYIMQLNWHDERFLPDSRLTHRVLQLAPKVIVTDFGFLHNRYADMFLFENQFISSSIFKHWNEIFTNFSSSHDDDYTMKILQRVGNYQGRSASMSTAEEARRSEEIISIIAREKFGFTKELDLGLFGAAQLELVDGIHVSHLNILMEHLVLVNLLCQGRLD